MTKVTRWAANFLNTPNHCRTITQGFQFPQSKSRLLIPPLLSSLFFPVSAIFFFLFLNWRIALQYYVCFCCTTMNQLHVYHLLLEPPPTPHLTPSRSSQRTELSSLCFMRSLTDIYTTMGTYKMEFEPTASPQNKEKKNLKIKKNLNTKKSSP